MADDKADGGKKRGFWSRLLGGKDEPQPKETPKDQSEDQTSANVTPEDAAALEKEQPWQEPKDSIDESIDKALDQIEEDLKEAPDAEPPTPAPEEAAAKAVETVEEELQEISELEQAAQSPSEPENEETTADGDDKTGGGAGDGSAATGGGNNEGSGGGAGVANVVSDGGAQKDSPGAGQPRGESAETANEVSDGGEKPGGGAGDGSAPTGGGEKKKGWFARLRDGLKRSSDQLTDNISSIFTKRKLDDEALEELEDTLIQADLGVETAIQITEKLAQDRFDKEISVEEIRSVLRDEVSKVLAPVAVPFELGTAHKPHILLMVGVNGSGKTTTIGKLAAKYSREGKKVMLAAGDTFRAAAVEQLSVWGERSNVPVITRPTGADASGLAYDAVKEAQAQNCDLLIIDTAGRLQNRDELMAELEKIIRVIKKLDPDAPHTTMLTLDATTGQNALNQVEIFGKRAGVTGLVMTKLDGTARGGILVAIAQKHKLPVHFIGVGETIEDLEPFEADDFAAAIAGVQ
ncbi:signal recognition particle-docking protein FtsY [Maritalea mediterranea]|uniref:Signal recognition particle receptor FtsY n=1 Tax=Maritalea mediterranea TaxID=2909667 RepID=A0ABS9E3R3_9HYPH|nr:signal recognition particle-docking protein FtsY [Maritalea mediterranea]MCF4096879.1 signal recognition particle-docking protein FtsY [Maritalea mediterranea]